MTTHDDPERRLAEALRVQAGGGRRPPSPAVRASAPGPGMSVPMALLLALLAGAVLGTGLALLTLLVPGVLPALG